MISVFISQFEIRSSQFLRRVSCDRGPIGHVARDDRARADNCTLADAHAAQDGRVAADAGAALYNGSDYLPVSLSLERAGGCSRARILVINKHDPVPDKDLVFNGHAFANETVRRDFTMAAHTRALLNLNERSDAGSVANLAAVQIYEVINFDILPEFYVGRDQAELSGHERECVGVSC